MTNNLKLSDNDLWQISAQMNAIKWRALGRTLGLDEDILLNLEHAHKSAGVRECAYQMLLEWKVNYEIEFIPVSSVLLHLSKHLIGSSVLSVSPVGEHNLSKRQQAPKLVWAHRAHGKTQQKYL